MQKKKMIATILTVVFCITAVVSSYIVEDAFSENINTNKTANYNGSVTTLTNQGIDDEAVKVFNGGASGAHYFRIPAMATLSNDQKLESVNTDEDIGFNKYRSAASQITGGIQSDISVDGLKNLIFNLYPFRTKESIKATANVSAVLNTEDYIAAYLSTAKYNTASEDVKKVISTFVDMDVDQDEVKLKLSQFSNVEPYKTEGNYDYYGPVSVIPSQGIINNKISISSSSDGVSLTNFKLADISEVSSDETFLIKVDNTKKYQDVKIKATIHSFNERLRFMKSINNDNEAGWCVVPYLQEVENSTTLNAGNFGRLGTIKLQLVDQDDSSKLLSNATFKFTKVGGGTELILKTVDGEIITQPIPVGTYKVQQIDAPLGYIKVDTIKDVNIPYDNAITNIVYTNKQISAGVTVKIQDEQGLPIDDGEIKIYDALDQEVYSSIMDKSGKVSTTLPYGYYTVKQTRAKAGYLVDKTIKNINITSINAVSDVVFTNKEFKGSVCVSFIDGSNKTALSNGSFTIYNSNGVPVVSDKEVTSTVTQVNDLPVGSYYVKQTSTTKGYKLNTNVYPFAIIQDQEIPTVNIPLMKQKGAVEFIAYNEKGAFIPNVSVVLFDDTDREIATARTDANGSVIFSNLDTGNYYVQAQELPSGYVHSNTKHNATLDTDGQVKQVRETFKSLTSNIVVKKIDGDTSAPISGSVLIVYNSDKVEVDRLITDSTGEARTTLPYGEYVVQEYSAAPGYVLNGEKKTINVVNNNETVNVTLVGYKIKSKIIIKVVKDVDNEPISGATFKLLNSNNQVVSGYDSITTDYKGVATISDLTSGSYTLVQTGTSSDCKPLTTTIPFSVTKTDSVINVNVENFVRRGTIALLYKDTESNVPVEGGEFTLYTQKGSEVSKATSNNKGYVIFKNIPYGKYYIKMTGAPAGYEINQGIIGDSYKTAKASIFGIQKVYAEDTITLDSNFVGINGATPEGAGVSDNQSSSSGSVSITTGNNTNSGSNSNTGSTGNTNNSSNSGNSSNSSSNSSNTSNAGNNNSNNITIDNTNGNNSSNGSTNNSTSGTEINNSETGNTTVVPAVKIKGTVKVYVKDESNNSLSGVKVSLYKVNNSDYDPSNVAKLDLNKILTDASQVLTDTVSTDTNGVATFSSVPYGFYVVKQETIKEHKTPANQLTYILTSSDVKTITFVNTLDAASTSTEATTEAVSESTTAEEKETTESVEEASSVDNSDDTTTINNSDDIETINNNGTVDVINNRGSVTVSVPKTGMHPYSTKDIVLIIIAIVLLIAVVKIYAMSDFSKHSNKEKEDNK